MGSDSSRDSGFIFFLAVLEAKTAWSESHLKLYNLGERKTPRGKVDREGPRLLQNGRLCSLIPKASAAMGSSSCPCPHFSAHTLSPLGQMLLYKIISAILGVLFVPLCHFFSAPSVEGTTSGEGRMEGLGPDCSCFPMCT